MTDIAMCRGERGDGLVCPMKFKCHRYTAIPDGQYQSWFMVAPFVINQEGPECEHYWPMKEAQDDQHD